MSAARCLIRNTSDIIYPSYSSHSLFHQKGDILCCTGLRAWLTGNVSCVTTEIHRGQGTALPCLGTALIFMDGKFWFAFIWDEWVCSTCAETAAIASAFAEQLQIHHMAVHSGQDANGMTAEAIMQPLSLACSLGSLNPHPPQVNLRLIWMIIYCMCWIHVMNDKGMP